LRILLPNASRWLLEYLFAASVILNLACLPMRLNRHSLPDLLNRMAARPGSRASHRKLDPQRAANIVRHVAKLRIFRSSVFPRPCLRRALVLFKHLRHMGYPAKFVIGVLSHDGTLRAHSWVTVDTRAVEEPDATNRYRPVYSYPRTNSDQPIGLKTEWIRDLSHSGDDGYDVG